MANINKIRLSGQTYDIQDPNASKTVELTQAQYDALVSGGTVDPNTFYVITDAQGADLSNYYTKSETSGATEISTALNAKADTATTYTKTEVDNAITAATSTKQDTLVSGTNIKTINNESLLGSGNITIQGGGSGSSYTAGDGIDITNDVISVTGKVDTTTFNTYSGSVDTALSEKQDTLSAGTGINITDNVISATGGGGKAVSAGTNISITTGETADTINCTLPITLTKQKTSIYGDNDNLTIFNLNKTNEINHTGTTDNIIIGNSNKIGSNFDPSRYNFIFGNYNTLNQGFGGSNSSYNFIVGEYNTIGKNHSENASHTALFGTYLTPKNNYEYDFGKYNNSVSGSSTFGDSGNTLFSVGNGTADNARHNAFEIRQNGDIYCSDGTNDVKLQDTITATSANTTALGGLKLVKLSQSEYDSLTTKDNSTLYIIIN